MTLPADPQIVDEVVVGEHTSRLGLVEAVAVVGIVMCVAGIALPWAEFDFGTQGTFTGWNRRGFTILTLAAVAFAAVVGGGSRWKGLLGAVAGSLAGLFVLDFWLGELSDLPKRYEGFELTLGLGLPLMLAGSLVLVAVAIFRFAESNNL